VPNSDHANYEVTLVQADNQWHFEYNVNAGDAQDLYYFGNTAPGYSNGLDNNSGPNSHWWDGNFSGLKLSDFSASATTMTVQADKEEPSPVPPPAAPSNLRGSASKTAITLTWIDNANTEEGFYIERSTQSATTGFTRINTAGIDSTTYTDPIGTGRGTYYYRVQAFNSAGSSLSSNTVVVKKTR
jgi:hypothetical protein